MRKQHHTRRMKAYSACWKLPQVKQINRLFIYQYTYRICLFARYPFGLFLFICHINWKSCVLWAHCVGFSQLCTHSIQIEQFSHIFTRVVCANKLCTQSFSQSACKGFSTSCHLLNINARSASLHFVYKVYRYILKKLQIVLLYLLYAQSGYIKI